MEDMIESKFLVSLDDVLDTRLTTIFRLNKKTMRTVLERGYASRVHDSYPDIPDDEFKREYEKRTKEILEEALPTTMLEFVKEFIETTVKASMGTPVPMSPTLMINTHPYDLTEDEIGDTVKGIATVLNGVCNVEAISKSMTELTPKWLHDNVVMVSMYDYSTWLEYHAEKQHFHTTPCPEVILIAPTIITADTMPPLQEINNLFMKTSSELRPMVNISFVPTSVFSTGIVIKKTEDDNDDG